MLPPISSDSFCPRSDFKIPRSSGDRSSGRASSRAVSSGCCCALSATGRASGSHEGLRRWQVLRGLLGGEASPVSVGPRETGVDAVRRPPGEGRQAHCAWRATPATSPVACLPGEVLQMVASLLVDGRVRRSTGSVRPFPGRGFHPLETRMTGGLPRYDDVSWNDVCRTAWPPSG